jgi:hypothetical protein
MLAKDFFNLLSEFKKHSPELFDLMEIAIRPDKAFGIPLPLDDKPLIDTHTGLIILNKLEECNCKKKEFDRSLSSLKVGDMMNTPLHPPDEYFTVVEIKNNLILSKFSKGNSFYTASLLELEYNKYRKIRHEDMVKND